MGFGEVISLIRQIYDEREGVSKGESARARARVSESEGVRERVRASVYASMPRCPSVCLEARLRKTSGSVLLLRGRGLYLPCALALCLNEKHLRCGGAFCLDTAQVLVIN